MEKTVYYLHENGRLICKPNIGGEGIADLRDSELVKHFWVLDAGDRENAWSILVEAAALGANKKRIEELAKKWGCNDEDAQTYADRINIRLYPDGSAWCATRHDFTNLQESTAGFSEESALYAMAELCREIGFRAQKLWGSSFKELANA